jgi:hypothetical protein
MLERYRNDPEKWIEAVRAWQDANPEYVRACQRWWWSVNRNEARIQRMKQTTKIWRIRQRIKRIRASLMIAVD